MSPEMMYNVICVYLITSVHIGGYVTYAENVYSVAPTEQAVATERSPNAIELEIPSLYYYLSGNLRLSFKLAKNFMYGDYRGDLINLSDNATVYSEPLYFSSKNPWGTIEIPCTTFLAPGVYAFHIFPTGKAVPRVSSGAPEMVSHPIEVRWLESIKWFLSTRDIRTSSQALIANVSLYSQTACPQQEPANISVSVNLHYTRPAGNRATEVVTSRRLVWPFGTIRSPINSSLQFPCQFFDRPGSYYTSLSLTVQGRKIILDRSPSINASRRLSDYSLHVMAEHISRCINSTAKAEDSGGVRVAYKAPQCLGNDRLRLYQIRRGSLYSSTYKGIDINNFQQVYLMEKSIRSRPRFASFHFPCHIFSSHRADAVGFCFVYTTISRDGQSNELPETRQCFPVPAPAEERARNWGQRAEWSEWGAWSPCTQTCRKGHEDISVRMRYRRCMIGTNDFYGHLCSGKGLETMECHVPRCKNYAANDSQVANVMIWFPNSNPNGETVKDSIVEYTNIGILGFYAREKSDLSGFLEGDEYFVPVVISASIFLILLLMLTAYPSICRLHSLPNPPRKKPGNSSKDNDRDSRYLLISKDDEPHRRSPKPVMVNVTQYDQRNASVEMRTFPASTNCNPLVSTARGVQNSLSKVNENKDSVQTNSYGTERCRINGNVIRDDKAPWETPQSALHNAVNMQRANRLNDGGTTDSPKSSRYSQVSSRPETGDVQDLEYDDFIPDPIDDEDHVNTWPAKTLDIQVFATAYEEILKELSSTQPNPLQSGNVSFDSVDEEQACRPVLTG
ncbi:uncharacterized protein LOC129583983 [Paramacrobiotus metropolitanus]|uniref:uncharacterized protein LOC129583983 n=1 Tax=Paramacrobiotus metropolitanus TaxID=2943436 RepID=UPI0024463335|nr:uncharacterized protein LOC129583983 [Paramacrobiotus metropolitanus]